MKTPSQCKLDYTYFKISEIYLTKLHNKSVIVLKYVPSFRLVCNPANNYLFNVSKS